MNSLTLSFIVFGCIFGDTVLGMVLRRVLPKEHMSDKTKDVVKLGMASLAR
jgi:hypothetical protein